MTPDLPSDAFRIALRGLAVFPLAAGSKEPIFGSHGHLDASSDCDVARARWAKAPKANIGIATGSRSGFWALDIDPRHHGNRSLARLMSEHGELPETISVRTPSGGVHMWWKWPSIEIRNSAGQIGEGIDVRGEGGYVLAPPSRLSNGRSYRWIETGARAITSAPEWLIKVALPPRPAPRRCPPTPPSDLDRYVAGAIRDELDQLENAREGTRNDQLNRTAFAVAGFVHAGAVPEDWALSKLESVASDIGLPVPEARRTIASAFRAAPPREFT
jgi:hypothetical protein